MTGRRRDRRWRVAVAAAAFLLAAGLWTGDRVLVVAAALPLGYLAYGRLSTVPPVEDAVGVERELSTDAFPGERVEVRLTLRNEAERALPDVRVVDAVPSGLTAVSGPPVAVAALRPGEAEELAYEVVARRGRHEFGAVSVRARSLSAGTVSTADVQPSGDAALSCRVAAAGAPLRDRTRRFVGAIPTSVGGEGVTFHSTRKYRRGDALSRIDWRRFARTGDLTTVEYRVQEAARVLVVVDARDDAVASPGPAYPDARELSAYAAELLAEVLLARGHEAGVAAFGLDLPGTRGDGTLSVLPPGSGERFQTRVADVCDAVAEADEPPRESTASPGASDDDGGEASGWSVRGGRARESSAADGGGDARTRRETDADAAAERLLARLDGCTQVTFVTPALDDFPVAVTETLRGHGHDVTVVSPDATDEESLGGRLARVERAERVNALRASGGTVVDWSLADPLWLAVAPALAEVGR